MKQALIAAAAESSEGLGWPEAFVLVAGMVCFVFVVRYLMGE